MITINKTTDNMFKITYLNDGGVELGYAVAEFKPSELKTLIKFNDLYFSDIYSDAPQLDTTSIGIATKAIIKRAVVAVGNEQFSKDSWKDSWDLQTTQASIAIYPGLTSKVGQQIKDCMKKHGYEV